MTTEDSNASNSEHRESHSHPASPNSGDAMDVDEPMNDTENELHDEIDNDHDHDHDNENDQENDHENDHDDEMEESHGNDTDQLDSKSSSSAPTSTSNSSNSKSSSKGKQPNKSTSSKLSETHLTISTTHSSGAASAAAAVGAAGVSPTEEANINSLAASGSSSIGNNTTGAISSSNPPGTPGPSGATGGANTPQQNKPKRGGSKPILKVSGIARVDNSLKPTLFSSTQQINQKNYYTDYLRRDDQVMYYREWNEDQRRQKDAKEEAAKAKVDGVITVDGKEDPEPLPAGAKTIVIHMGSENLRIGLASQAYPKVSANVIAHRKPYPVNNSLSKPNNDPSSTLFSPSSLNTQIPQVSQEYEQAYEKYLDAEAEYENSSKPTFKQPTEPDAYLMYGKTFKTAHSTVYRDFRERMRFYKRRIVPNSHELVVSFNRRSRAKPEFIPDHNDPGRIEWVNPEHERWPISITGSGALTILPELLTSNIPQNKQNDKDKNNSKGATTNGSNPDEDTEMKDSTEEEQEENNHPPYVYELKWPIRHGLFNETDYNSAQELLGDISLILVDAIERDLGITFKDYREYNTVLIIPDLYTRSYVDNMVSLLLQMGLSGVAVIQESMAATFGAGVSTACVIDIGAQTSSIACVEEGMIIPDSRVNLKFGGDDVVIALAKLLLMSSFPYAELNLARAYDFSLIEDLKHRYATTNDADITVQLYTFIKRTPGQAAEKFQFKVFEEVMLAPLGFFYPDVFDQTDKQNTWCYKTKQTLKSAFEEEEETPKVSLKKKTDENDDLEDDPKSQWETVVPARYSLFPRSYDIYDSIPNDPESAAQYAIARQKLTVYNMPVGPNAVSRTPNNNNNNNITTSTSAKPSENGSSVAGTSRNTPVPGNTTNDEGTLKNNSNEEETTDIPVDPVLFALTGLDHAIIESITQAGLSKLQAAGQIPGGIIGVSASGSTSGSTNAGSSSGGGGPSGATSSSTGGGGGGGSGTGTNNPSAVQQHSNSIDPATIISNLASAEQGFYENLLIVGGAAAKLPGFNTLLTDRVGMWLSHAGHPVPAEISVMPAPREMDPQVLTWKGGGVFAKLKIVSECWISSDDWDMLGNRALQYKTLFAY